MQGYLKYYLVFVILMFIFVPIIFADEIKYGYVSTDDGTGLFVRTGAGTNFPNIGDGLSDGEQVKILSEHIGDKNCKTWYKIIYTQSENNEGYVCSKFINLIEIKPDKNFDETLKKFPESYHEDLKLLHAIYPNAIFNPYDTRLDFNEVVNNESILGKSLLWDSGNNRDGLKNLDSYNLENNHFNNNYPGGGVNWYAASKDTISYYLDPRNFLNETRIFMFESLSYVPNVHKEEGVKSILSGSFMQKEMVDKKDKTFAQVIMESGSNYQVSPYYLASRIIQETGYTRSALVKGIYPDYPQYNGYYNFFNYGAGGSNVIENGLKFAFKNEWNSEEKAINGGAQLVVKDYISKGQNTTYFQKWHVTCPSKNIGSCNLYINQYMQNIEAPYNEAFYTYQGYKKILKDDLYSMSFVFNIPVYKNMPDKRNLPSEKSPINYLKKIYINNSELPNFDSYNNEYEIEIVDNLKAIEIKVDKIENKASVTGIGKINITKDEQIIPIKVTAENGSVNTYNLKIKLTNSKKMNLEQTLNNVEKGYINGNVITGITNIEDMKKLFLNANNLVDIKIYDIKNNLIDSGNIGTGYKIIVSVDSENKEFKSVIYGDTNGDAEIDILDLLRIQKHILKASTLNDIEKQAGDVSKDNVIDILDLLKVQKHILKASIIKQ